MKTILVSFFLLLNLAAGAQEKYWVFFTNKRGVCFDPPGYFDAKAIARRLQYKLPLYDSTDYPVNHAYISAVSALADSIGYASRWLNAVAVYARPDAIKLMEGLSFVKEVAPMQSHAVPAAIRLKRNIFPKADTALIHYQTGRLQGRKFRQAGISGKGIRIAVLDVGFSGADKHPAFDHLRANKQIVASWDFIKQNENVYHGGEHGTAVLSCIAGMYDTIPMGLATGAEFLLARTERDNSEWRDEEDFWLAAAEWADKNGASIITTSLAYTLQRYFYRDMTGSRSVISRAATMAVKKGILVIAAAGNEADEDWKYIATPADADSILTIGGSDPYTDFHISYSSLGPNALGHLKPNLIAPAHDWVAAGFGYQAEDGTSFAAPIVCGFAACAWQMNRRLSNTQLFDALQHSGHLYPYYDYANGYGIPQAGYFTDKNSGSPVMPSFKIIEAKNEDGSDLIKIVLNDSNFMGAIDSSTRRKHTYLYCHFADSNNLVIKYFVIKVFQKEALSFRREQIPPGITLRVFMDGYMEERKF